MVYKLISKTLANRLKLVFNDIISVNQSAFIPGRLIFNNAILEFELMQKNKSQRNGKTGHCAYKLDVEWDFLEQMMKKPGFLEG